MATHKFVCLILAAIVTTAAASDDGWTDPVSGTDAEEYTMKIGSFEVTTTRGGDEVASVIGRLRDKKNNTILVEKWYVKTTDCANGYGELVTLSVSGEYKYANPFATNDGSVGGSIADFICELHKRIKQESEKRGI